MTGIEKLPRVPVILIHTEDPPKSGLSACLGLPFEIPDENGYRGTPRMICPGCLVRFRQHRTDADRAQEALSVLKEIQRLLRSL